MKWSLVIWILLVSTALARPRTKRSIGHLKSLIVNKLFGIGGKTVIVARPILSNNETFQLFKIPGIDDFLLKVSKNDKKLETEKLALDIKDPVIVKPEVAIVGSYLGTTTQKETMLAIEMVKNLVRSGILTGRLDSSMQEFLIPQSFGEYIEEGVLAPPMQIITETEGHNFVPEYPEFFVPPELKLAYPNSKYYYKQEGHDADMTYESHDNKDVLVTRISKQRPNIQVSDAAKKNENFSNSNAAPMSQPLRINGQPSHYYVNNGMITGPIPLSMQNQIPMFNVNQGVSGNPIPEKGQNPPPSVYLHQGMISGNEAIKGQNLPPGYFANQGMISGNVAGKGEIPPFGFVANHGIISGKMPGQGKNPTGGYYVDQGIISGQGKHPTYYVNQGIVTGGLLGQVPYGAPTYDVNSGITGSAQVHVGNGPAVNNVNTNLIGNGLAVNNVNPNVAGYFEPVHPASVYYVNPATVEGSSGQIPSYLSYGTSKPNINEIGQQFIGNYVNGGAILAEPLQMGGFVHPYNVVNKAQRVICEEKQDKACPYDKTEKITLNPTQYTNKPAVNQQSVSNTNSTFGNAKNNVVNEFLKNHTVNGQIVAQYSYKQLNSQSNKNYTEVRLDEPAFVETKKNVNKDFIYIPPGDSSIDLSLKNENDDKNAFTSKVNVRTNKGEIKRFNPSNIPKGKMRINLKQNPIVVAEKRSNETDEKPTKPDENSNGEIPGSTY